MSDKPGFPGVDMCPRHGENTSTMAYSCLTCRDAEHNKKIAKLEVALSAAKKERDRYRTALERIQSRANKIMQAEIKCTNFSAAHYNFEVCEAALSAKGE